MFCIIYSNDVTRMIISSIAFFYPHLYHWFKFWCFVIDTRKLKFQLGYVPTSLFFVFSRIFVRKPLGQIIHFQALGPTSANIYLFKVKDRNNRKKCEICSKLTRKTSEQRYDIPLLPLSEADLGLLQHARWSALW